MRAYLGVTDGEWYRYLSERPEITEVNFWKPGGGQIWNALDRGEPFIFKTKWPDGNRLVGGGRFEGFVRLKVSEAWDFFGEGNGTSSQEALVQKIVGYQQGATLNDDPVIGCILLNRVRFLPSSETVPAPNDFAKSIVAGKGYPLFGTDSNPIVDSFVRRLGRSELAVEIDEPHRVAGPVFGEARLTVPRLGQGGFKALVMAAYDRRCSITGHKIAPTLQAAHILPVSNGGEHRLDNGLLLRSDVHTMFDRGYLGVATDFTLRVSPRLRSEFGNGDEFYSKQGEVIALPKDNRDRPSPEFLEWHMDTVYKAS